MPLNKRQKRFLKAACEVLIPKDAPVAISGIEAGTIENLEEFLDSLPKSQRKLIPWLFRLLGILAFLKKFKPLYLQSSKQRENFFSWLEKNKVYFFRISYYSLKTLLGLGYFANVDVMKGIGYFKNCEYPNDPWKIVVKRGYKP